MAEWRREYGQHLNRVNISQPLAAASSLLVLLFFSSRAASAFYPQPSMRRPRNVHRFFEQFSLSSYIWHTSVFWLGLARATAGEIPQPRGQRGTKHIACAPNTQLQPAGCAGNVRIRYLLAPMVFALSIGIQRRIRRSPPGHAFNEDSRKKNSTRYLASSRDAPRTTMKLENRGVFISSFSLPFFLSSIDLFTRVEENKIPCF